MEGFFRKFLKYKILKYVRKVLIKLRLMIASVYMDLLI